MIGVYKISCGQRFYIGSSTNIEKRISSHCKLLKRGKHENPKMQNAFNKHQQFEFEILEETDLPQLLVCEQFYLDQHFSDPMCLNINPKAEKPPGLLGRNGKAHPRFGKPPWNKGRRFLVGVNNPMFGKRHTRTSKEKMRQAKLGSKSYMFGKTGKQHHNFGRRWNLSEETKGRIRQVLTGRHKSKNHKLNISLSKTGTKTGSTNPNWKGGTSYKYRKLKTKSNK